MEKKQVAKFYDVDQENSVIEFFVDKLYKDRKVHYAELFKYLSLNPKIKHSFQKHTRSQQLKFFRTKPLYFKICDDSIYLQNEFLKPNGEVYPKISGAVNFLLRCFDSLKYLDIKKVIMFIFDDVARYIYRLSLENERALLSSIPNVLQGQCGILNLFTPCEIRTEHISMNDKILLAIICYLVLYGKTFREHLLRKIKSVAPVEFDSIFEGSSVKPHQFLERHNSYFQISKNGVVQLYEYYASYKCNYQGETFKGIPSRDFHCKITQKLDSVQNASTSGSLNAIKVNSTYNSGNMDAAAGKGHRDGVFKFFKKHRNEREKKEIAQGHICKRFHVAVQFLLNCFESLHHLEMTETICFVLKDVGEFLLGLNTSLRRETFSRVPSTTMDDLGFLQKKQSTALSLDVVTKDDLLLLFIVYYLSLHGKSHFEEVVKDLRNRSPQVVSMILSCASTPGQSGYLRKYPQYFRMDDKGNLELLSTFVLHLGSSGESSDESSKSGGSDASSDSKGNSSSSSVGCLISGGSLRMSDLPLTESNSKSNCAIGGEIGNFSKTGVSEQHSTLLSKSNDSRSRIVENDASCIKGILKINNVSSPNTKIGRVNFVDKDSQWCGEKYLSKSADFSCTKGDTGSDAVIDKSDYFPQEEVDNIFEFRNATVLKDDTINENYHMNNITNTSDLVHANFDESSPQEKSLCHVPKEKYGKNYVSKRIISGTLYLLKFFKAKRKLRLFLRVILKVLSDVHLYFLNLSVGDKKEIIKATFAPCVKRNKFIISTLFAKYESLLSRHEKELLYFCYSVNSCDEIHYKKLYESYFELDKYIAGLKRSDADMLLYFKKFTDFFVVNKDGNVKSCLLPNLEVPFNFFPDIFESSGNVLTVPNKVVDIKVPKDKSSSVTKKDNNLHFDKDIIHKKVLACDIWCKDNLLYKKLCTCVTFLLHAFGPQCCTHLVKCISHVLPNVGKFVSELSTEKQLEVFSSIPLARLRVDHYMQLTALHTFDASNKPKFDLRLLYIVSYLALHGETHSSKLLKDMYQSVPEVVIDDFSGVGDYMWVKYFKRSSLYLDFMSNGSLSLTSSFGKIDPCATDGALQAEDSKKLQAVESRKLQAENSRTLQVENSLHNIGGDLLVTKHNNIEKRSKASDTADHTVVAESKQNKDMSIVSKGFKKNDLPNKAVSDLKSGEFVSRIIQSPPPFNVENWEMQKLNAKDAVEFEVTKCCETFSIEELINLGEDACKLKDTNNKALNKLDEQTVLTPTITTIHDEELVAIVTKGKDNLLDNSNQPNLCATNASNCDDESNIKASTSLLICDSLKTISDTVNMSNPNNKTVVKATKSNESALVDSSMQTSSSSIDVSYPNIESVVGPLEIDKNSLYTKSSNINISSADDIQSAIEMEENTENVLLNASNQASICAVNISNPVNEFKFKPKVREENILLYGSNQTIPKNINTSNTGNESAAISREHNKDPLLNCANPTINSGRDVSNPDGKESAVKLTKSVLLGGSYQVIPTPMDISNSNNEEPAVQPRIDKKRMLLNVSSGAISSIVNTSNLISEAPAEQPRNNNENLLVNNTTIPSNMNEESAIKPRENIAWLKDSKQTISSPMFFLNPNNEESSFKPRRKNENVLLDGSNKTIDFTMNISYPDDAVKLVEKKESSLLLDSNKANPSIMNMSRRNNEESSIKQRNPNQAVLDTVATLNPNKEVLMETKEKLDMGGKMLTNANETLNRNVDNENMLTCKSSQCLDCPSLKSTLSNYFWLKGSSPSSIEMTLKSSTVKKQDKRIQTSIEKLHLSCEKEPSSTEKQNDRKLNLTDDPTNPFVKKLTIESAFAKQPIGRISNFSDNPTKNSLLVEPHTTRGISNNMLNVQDVLSKNNKFIAQCNLIDQRSTIKKSVNETEKAVIDTREDATKNLLVSKNPSKTLLSKFRSLKLHKSIKLAEKSPAVDKDVSSEENNNYTASSLKSFKSPPILTQKSPAIDKDVSCEENNHYNARSIKLLKSPLIHAEKSPEKDVSSENNNATCASYSINEEFEILVPKRIDVPEKICTRLQKGIKFLLKYFECAPDFRLVCVVLHVVYEAKYPFLLLSDTDQIKLVKKVLATFKDSKEGSVLETSNCSTDMFELSKEHEDLLVISHIISQCDRIHYNEVMKSLKPHESTRASSYFRAKSNFFTINRTGYIKLKDFPPVEWKSDRLHSDAAVSPEAASARKPNIEEKASEKKPSIVEAASSRKPTIEEDMKKSKDIAEHTKKAWNCPFNRESVFTANVYTSPKNNAGDQTFKVKDVAVEKVGNTSLGFLSDTVHCGIVHLMQYFEMRMNSLFFEVVFHALKSCALFFELPHSQQQEIIRSSLKKFHVDTRHRIRQLPSTPSPKTSKLSEEEKKLLCISYLIRQKGGMHYEDVFAQYEECVGQRLPMFVSDQLLFFQERKDLFFVDEYWMVGLENVPVIELDFNCATKDNGFSTTLHENVSLLPVSVIQRQLFLPFDETSLGTKGYAEQLLEKGQYDSIHKDAMYCVPALRFFNRIRESITYLSRSFEVVSKEQIIRTLLHVLNDVRNCLVDESYYYKGTLKTLHSYFDAESSISPQQLNRPAVELTNLNEEEKDLLVLICLLIQSGPLHYLALFKEFEAHGGSIKSMSPRDQYLYLEKKRKYFAIDGKGEVNFNINHSLRVLKLDKFFYDAKLKTSFQFALLAGMSKNNATFEESRCRKFRSSSGWIQQDIMYSIDNICHEILSRKIHDNVKRVKYQCLNRSSTEISSGKKQDIVEPQCLNRSSEEVTSNKKQDNIKRIESQFPSTASAEIVTSKKQDNVERVEPQCLDRSAEEIKSNKKQERVESQSLDRSSIVRTEVCKSHEAKEIQISNISKFDYKPNFKHSSEIKLGRDLSTSPFELNTRTNAERLFSQRDISPKCESSNVSTSSVIHVSHARDLNDSEEVKVVCEKYSASGNPNNAVTPKCIKSDISVSNTRNFNSSEKVKIASESDIVATSKWIKSGISSDIHVSSARNLSASEKVKDVCEKASYSLNPNTEVFSTGSDISSRTSAHTVPEVESFQKEDEINLCLSPPPNNPNKGEAPEACSKVFNNPIVPLYNLLELQSNEKLPTETKVVCNCTKDPAKERTARNFFITILCQSKPGVSVPGLAKKLLLASTEVQHYISCAYKGNIKLFLQNHATFYISPVTGNVYWRR